MFDFKKKITDIHYGEKPFWFSALFLIPACVYFLAVSLKNCSYIVKFRKEKKVKPYVICVGNITTGGVGKTPIVMEIANNLTNKGKRVCVLSRGYGGKLSGRKPVLVRDYEKIILDDPFLVGDEVNLVSKNVNCPVIICKNRVAAANYAYEKLNTEIIVMDDGFSHRKIHRDLNIIVWDAKKLYGNGSMLPLGPLREPLSEVWRADKIIFVDKNNEINKKLKEYALSLRLPYFICKMDNGEIYNINGEHLNAGANVLAFSGIGSPEQFYKKLNDFNVVKTISFDDHYKYSQKNVNDIIAAADKCGADAIITTEKDMVKISRFQNVEKIYALKLKPALDIEGVLKEVQ